MYRQAKNVKAEVLSGYTSGQISCSGLSKRMDTPTDLLPVSDADVEEMMTLNLMHFMY